MFLQKTTSKHINKTLKEECFDSAVAKFATAQIERNRSVTRKIEYFNLDVIASVGYRVKLSVVSYLENEPIQYWGNNILKLEDISIDKLLSNVK